MRRGAAGRHASPNGGNAPGAFIVIVERAMTNSGKISASPHPPQAAERFPKAPGLWRILGFLLLLALPAQAADLKVATWNLEWLTLRRQGDGALPDNVVPKRAEDMDLLRR